MFTFGDEVVMRSGVVYVVCFHYFGCASTDGGAGE